MSMFAMFDADTARPPIGISGPTEFRHRNMFDEDGILDLKRQTNEHTKKASSRYKQDNTHTLDLSGGNAFTYERGPFCHCTSKDGVHSLFAGGVSRWPGIDMMQSQHDAFVRGDPHYGETSDATWLLEFYKTFIDIGSDAAIEAALNSLSKTEGQFAFVVYDSNQGRVLAARDAGGVQPLFWGSTPDGFFMLSSDINDLAQCNPTATRFPAGSLYTNEGNNSVTSPREYGSRSWIIPQEQKPGHLHSFVKHSSKPVGKHAKPWRSVKAVPRLDEQGVMCGAVYRVASDRNVASMASAH